MRRLWLRDDLAAQWPADELFARIDALPGATFRDVARRRTLRVSIDGEALFLKRHWGVGWIEIAKNLLTLRRPVLGAGDEYRAVAAAAAAGVRVPRVVGFAERGWNPAERDSFLLSRAIEPSVSLEDFMAEWATSPPSPVARRRLIAAVAGQVRALHGAGINHRDLYVCHFLLAPDSWPLAPELTLIDLHRAQVRSAVPERWRVKDLGALLFSAQHMGFSTRDWLRFIRHYSGRSLREELADGRRRRRWRAVARRARRLFEEAQRKGLVPESTGV